MITDELLDFIRRERANGMEMSDIEHLLLTEGGWTYADVTEALDALVQGGERSSPSPSVPPPLDLSGPGKSEVVKTQAATTQVPAEPVASPRASSPETDTGKEVGRVASELSMSHHTSVFGGFPMGEVGRVFQPTVLPADPITTGKLPSDPGIMNVAVSAATPAEAGQQNTQTQPREETGSTATPSREGGQPSSGELTVISAPEETEHPAPSIAVSVAKSAELKDGLSLPPRSESDEPEHVPAQVASPSLSGTDGMDTHIRTEETEHSGKTGEMPNATTVPAVAPARVSSPVEARRVERSIDPEQRGRDTVGRASAGPVSGQEAAPSTRKQERRPEAKVLLVRSEKKPSIDVNPARTEASDDSDRARRPSEGRPKRREIELQPGEDFLGIFTNLSDRPVTISAPASLPLAGSTEGERRSAPRLPQEQKDVDQHVAGRTNEGVHVTVTTGEQGQAKGVAAKPGATDTLPASSLPPTPLVEIAPRLPMQPPREVAPVATQETAAAVANVPAPTPTPLPSVPDATEERVPSTETIPTILEVSPKVLSSEEVFHSEKSDTAPSVPAASMPSTGSILARRTMEGDLLRRSSAGGVSGPATLGTPKRFAPAEVKVTSDTTSGRQEEGKRGAVIAASVNTGGSKEGKRSSVLSELLSRNAPGQSLQGGAIEKKEEHLFPVQRNERTRKVLLVVIATLIVVALVAGIVLVAVRYRKSDPSVMFGEAITALTQAPSLTYVALMRTDLTMTEGDETTSEVVARAAFRASARGAVEQGAQGFGDGSHTLTFEGDLRSSTLPLSGGIEVNVLAAQGGLYYRFVRFPETERVGRVDPEDLRAFWIKVDGASLARELGMSGLGEGSSGGFGQERSSERFFSLFLKDQPFRVGDRLGNRSWDGREVVAYGLTVDPKVGVALVANLYTKFTTENLVMSDEERVRLEEALTKIVAEVWIDETEQRIVRFSVEIPRVDDRVFGVRARGTLALTVDIPTLGEAVPSIDPSPMLTSDELALRGEVYRVAAERRERDRARYLTIRDLQTAISDYAAKERRYPFTLSMLEGAGVLSSSSVAALQSLEYSYAAYLNPGATTKSSRCTARSLSCTFYHLGVSFEEVENPLLESDEDRTTDVLGDDTAGCDGTPGLACFDIAGTLTTKTSSEQ